MADDMEERSSVSESPPREEHGESPRGQHSIEGLKDASREMPREPPDPVISKAEMAQKLSLMPIEKIRGIITNQIDLEIRLKHRELRLAEEEIGKCESQMLALRKFLDVPPEAKVDNEPEGLTVKYHELLSKSIAVNYSELRKLSQGEPTRESEDEPVHSYRTRSTTSSLRPSVTALQRQSFGCLYRRTDGIVVKLTCQDCQRSNFSSAQGFLNHSRIAHSKEYTSQDAAALTCGEVLPNVEQDEEGLASLSSLRDKMLDPSKNLNVNEIYFNGLSQTLNTVHDNGEELIKEFVKKESAPSPKTSIANDRKRSLSPLDMSEGELMKKLMKGGDKKSEEYQEMIKEAKESVDNAHLFSDEEEDPIAIEEQPTISVSLNSTRRRSRSGINPMIMRGLSTESSTIENGKGTNSIPNERRSLAGPAKEGPKLKLKLRNEDKKKSRHSK